MLVPFSFMKTVPVAPVATAATGVGETSFTANWNAFTGATYYLLDVSTSPSFSSFVLQDEFTTSTSYVVIGLTASTTYYYRVRANVGVDPDAQAFFDRVTAAGGTLSATEQTATNQLVLDMKAAGIWTKMKAVYPMVGASAAACAQNLKSSSFTGAFSSGWSFDPAGVIPNGTSAYMDTGLNVNTQLTQDSTHLSYYSRTNVISSQVEMGVTASNSTYLLFNFSGVAYSAINESTQAARATAANPTTGFLIGSRTSGTQERYFTNNVSQTRIANSTGKANLNIYLACYNNNAATLFSTKQCAFASIGDGLTDTEASNFYTAVQAFNTTLARNV